VQRQEDELTQKSPDYKIWKKRIEYFTHWIEGLVPRKKLVFARPAFLPFGTVGEAYATSANTILTSHRMTHKKPKLQKKLQSFPPTKTINYD